MSKSLTNLKFWDKLDRRIDRSDKEMLDSSFIRFRGIKWFFKMGLVHISLRTLCYIILKYPTIQYANNWYVLLLLIFLDFVFLFKSLQVFIFFNFTDLSVFNPSISTRGGWLCFTGHSREIDTERGIPSGERVDWRHTGRRAHCR